MPTNWKVWSEVTGVPVEELKRQAETLESNRGYHLRDIARGKFGETSKIREELEELEDALEQDNKIMAMCELSDLYGAVRAVADRMGLSMEDLRVMSDATERAFRSGHREPRE